MRFDRGIEPWGGRRVLYEVLRYYQLSDDKIQEQALTSFWNLRWVGDEFSQMSAFRADLVRVSEAASVAASRSIILR